MSWAVRGGLLCAALLGWVAAAPGQGFGGGAMGGGGMSGGGAMGGGGMSGGGGMGSGGLGGTFGSGNGMSGGMMGGGMSGGMSGGMMSGGMGGTTGFGGAGYGGFGMSGGVSPTNAFAGYFASPYVIATAANAASSGGTTMATARNATFGQPMYGNMSGMTGMMGAGTMGGMSGMTGMGSRMGMTGTTGTSGAPFTLTISPGGLGNTSAPPPTTGATNSPLQTQLVTLIQGSSSLPSKATIRVQVAGGTVILSGTVADDHERRLAANLLRLTPGVGEVRNDLQLR
jgi:hypothetical protein